MAKFEKGIVALAALALGITFGGSRAQASLTLSIAETGGPAIAIDSTGGTASLTGAAANATYTFLIDGQVVNFATDGSGAANGTFRANNNSTSFVADGRQIINPVDNSVFATLSGQFGDYTITAVTATQRTTSDGKLSNIQDVSTDLSGTTSTPASFVAKDLTITPTYSPFVSPSGKLDVVSTIGGTIESGSATFTSTVAGVQVPGSPLTVTPTVNSQQGEAVLMGVASGYTASNQIVISGLTGSHSDNIQASTEIAAPEPATLAMAFSALPLLGLAAWRNRRKSA